MSEKHPIDDLFREHLEDRKPEFNEAYWKEASQLLDQHTGSIFHFAKWKFFTMLTIGAVIIGAMGYYFGKTDRTNENEVAISAMETVQDKNEESNQFNKTGISTPGLIDSLSAEEQMIKTDTNQAITNAIEKDGANLKKETTVIAADKSSTAGSSKASKLKSESESSSFNQPHEEINYFEPKTTLNKDLSAKEKTSSADGELNNTYQHSTKVSDTKILTQNFVNSKPVSSSIEEDQKKQAAMISPQNNTTSIEFNNQIISFLSVDAFHISTTQEIVYPEKSTSVQLTDFMKRNHWSKVRSFEMSIAGGISLITVPAVKSKETGFEWNALLHYRINNWIAGAGIGQFSVKESFMNTTDSFADHSFTQTIVTIDSTWTLDSVIVIIDSLPVLIYDSVLHIIQDTSFQEITVIDTISIEKEAATAGRYFEIPIVFGYRFPLGKFRLQLTGGAAYGWYTGALRYGVNSEGQLISYQPGSVLSLSGRLAVQYPIRQRLFLQGYTGARYVIGLKKDVPENNYLGYSIGVGLLYRF